MSQCGYYQMKILLFFFLSFFKAGIIFRDQIALLNLEQQNIQPLIPDILE
jgi:hypothetical protein